MSRTGRKPLVIPDKVKINLQDKTMLVEGPLGKLKVNLTPKTSINIQSGKAVVDRQDDSREARMQHGLVRALLNNALIGVSKGFEKKLEIEGVGYRADAKGKILNLTLGFSHPINYEIPEGIKIAVDKQTKLTVSGFDKELVGLVAAKVRGFRAPEPYKGKGIRYENEVIQRKAGKAASSGK